MVPSLKTGSPTRNKKRLPFLGQALRLAVPPRLAAKGSYLVVTVNGVGRFTYFRVPIPGSGFRSQVVFAGFGSRGLSPLHPDLCQPGAGYSSWSMRLIINHYRHKIRTFQWGWVIWPSPDEFHRPAAARHRPGCRNPPGGCGD